MTDGTATHGWSIGRTAPETFDPRGDDAGPGAQATAAPDAHVAEAGGVNEPTWDVYGRCPYCFAKPGRPCMTRTTGKYISKPHPERPQQFPAVRP